MLPCRIGLLPELGCYRLFVGRYRLFNRATLQASNHGVSRRTYLIAFLLTSYTIAQPGLVGPPLETAALQGRESTYHILIFITVNFGIITK